MREDQGSRFVSRRGRLSRFATAPRGGPRHGRGDVAIGNERFEPVWMRFLAAKRPYLTDGSYENLEHDGIDGFHRSLPARRVALALLGTARTSA
jgi:hypothetical protein